MNIRHLTNKIIDVIKSMIDEQIIICDVDGIIIASTNQHRIGNYHEGAFKVINSKSYLIITEEMSTQLKGVKTGINLPLFFNKNVIGVIGITGEIEKVKPFGEIVRKMTELLINESYYTEQLEFEHRSIETFVFEWLHSKNLNKSLRDRAAALELSLDGEKQVILMAIDKEDSTLQKDIWQYINSIIPKKDILVRWGNNRLFWIHTVNKQKSIKKNYLKQIKEDCEHNFPLQLDIGVGQCVTPEHAHLSYEQALIALKYSVKNEGISFYAQLYLELCLQDISNKTKKEFIHRTIGNLKYNKQLLQTLIVFFEEELSYQKSADNLYIHKNTLHYRLSRIEEITGFNPRKFSELICLYLAVTFLKEDTSFL